MDRDFQGRLGAAFAIVDRKEEAKEGEATGFEVAAHYGSSASEAATLRERCGLADLSWQGRLEVAGPDRLRFLHAYTTCDVKGLTPGTGTYGFFTSPQGRILSDAAILALEDRLWLRVAPRQEEAVAAHLRKFILADRVEIRTLPEVRCLALAGPGAREVLAGTAEALDPLWRHVHATLAGAEVLAERMGGLGVEAYTLWVVAPEADRLAARLLEDPRVRPAGFEALETVRVEAGVPRWGRDYGAENFPQETGLEGAVSYTKGCYLGQEIVARIHYRGGVQKSLRGLRFAGEGAVPPGAVLLAEGRPAGAATSVADSPLLGRVGLSILHKRAADPGTLLEVEGGGRAEVVELPFRRD